MGAKLDDKSHVDNKWLGRETGTIKQQPLDGGGRADESDITMITGRFAVILN